MLLLVAASGCGNKAMKDARTYIQIKEYDRARELLDIELKTNPKNVEAYLLLGKVYLLQERAASASETFEKALLLDTGAKRGIAATYFEVAQSGSSEGRATELTGYCLREAVKYNPDVRGEASSWALKVATGEVQGKKTTVPISLLALIRKEVDPDCGDAYGKFALETARRYQEKTFLPEAIAWAIAAGDFSPDLVKSSAELLRSTALALPPGENERLVRSTLEKAIQWNPSLAKDDDVYWATQVRSLAEPFEAGKAASAYLESFPQGKHVGEARDIVASVPLFVVYKSGWMESELPSWMKYVGRFSFPNPHSPVVVELAVHFPIEDYTRRVQVRILAPTGRGAVVEAPIGKYGYGHEDEAAARIFFTAEDLGDADWVDMQLRAEDGWEDEDWRVLLLRKLVIHSVTAPAADMIAAAPLPPPENFIANNLDLKGRCESGNTFACQRLRAADMAK